MYVKIATKNITKFSVKHSTNCLATCNFPYRELTKFLFLKKKIILFPYFTNERMDLVKSSVLDLVKSSVLDPVQTSVLDPVQTSVLDTKTYGYVLNFAYRLLMDKQHENQCKMLWENAPLNDWVNLYSLPALEKFMTETLMEAHQNEIHILEAVQSEKVPGFLLWRGYIKDDGPGPLFFIRNNVGLLTKKSSPT